MATAVLIATDLLRSLPFDVAQAILRLADVGGSMPLPELAAPLRIEIETKLASIVGIDREAGVVAFTSEDMARIMRQARASLDGDDTGSALARIRAALRRYDTAEALAIFAHEGGAFFAHLHGVEAAQAAVNLFSEEDRRQSDMLTMADAINSMKSDNLAHADLLIERHFGVGGADVGRLTQPGDSVSVEFACFAFVRGVYRDAPVSDAELDFLLSTIARTPENAHLLLGLFHNVALDIHVRRRQWATAAETALRARYHLKAAAAPLLTFYIDIYRAIIGLHQADLSKAEAALSDAASALASAPVASRNDRLLLRLFGLIIEYERGNYAPLVEFSLKLDDDGLIGEIWPSAAEPILISGTRALSVGATLASTRFYLDRWKARGWNSRRFRALIAQSLAEAQLRRGRLREVEETLASLGAWPFSTTAADVDEIGLQTVAARTRLASVPDDADVAGWADRLVDHRQLTPRQQAEIALVQAISAEARHEEARFRDAMTLFLEIAVEGHLPALLIEHDATVHKLVSTRGNRGILNRSPRLQALLSSLKAEPEMEAADGSGPHLTGQEERILLLLAEGSSNRLIAERLGISLPTVRFHMKNLYRKLGGNSRADIAAMVEKGRFVL